MREYLEDTTKLLRGEQYKPEQRFYTLLLLAMVTCKGDQSFAKLLSKQQKLLNKIFQDA